MPRVHHHRSRILTLQQLLLLLLRGVSMLLFLHRAVRRRRFLHLFLSSLLLLPFQAFLNPALPPSLDLDYIINIPKVVRFKGTLRVILPGSIHNEFVLMPTCGQSHHA